MDVIAYWAEWIKGRFRDESFDVPEGASWHVHPYSGQHTVIVTYIDQPTPNGRRKTCNWAVDAVVELAGKSREEALKLCDARHQAALASWREFGPFAADAVAVVVET